MTPVLVTMIAILVVAVLALAYAAFPHRGAPVPGAPWVNRLLQRAVDAVPTVEDGDLDPVTDKQHTELEPSAAERWTSR